MSSRSPSHKTTEKEKDKPEKVSLFEMLRARFSAKQRMLQSLQQDDTTAVAQLLQQGFKVSSTVDVGMSPLHVAVSRNCLPMVELLLKAGANPNLKCPYSSALDEAVMLHRLDCLHLLLSHAPTCLDFENFSKTSMGLCHPYGNPDDDEIVIFIYATPNLNALTVSFREFLWCLCEEFPLPKCMEAWMLTGAAFDEKVVPRKSKWSGEFQAWHKSFCTTVQPLRHLCRIAVRRALQGHCNVFYGVRQLPLPQAMQNYLVFR